MKVFSCHLTEISTPILLANLIEIPSNSLFISSRITRCQTLDIKFFEEQEQCFFFRVNLQLLKLQLPLQLSYLQLNLYFCSSHHLHVV